MKYRIGSEIWTEKRSSRYHRVVYRTRRGRIFVDPVCHTLVGASLGATGLENNTRFGRSTLLVAANLPDIDFVLYFWGDERSYAFRRGITHGIPAMILLPLLLALLIAYLSRTFPASRTGREASLRWLVILSLIGVATHPALDWLNNYGMRWLMPMVDRWFYGDTLFIFDWVVWVALIMGLIAARRARRQQRRWFRQPTCLSLAFVLLYISTSFTMTQVAEQAALENTQDNLPRRLMASPVPFDPLERAIVFDYGSEYRFGTVKLGPQPRFEWEETAVPVGDPAAFERARQTREGRWFLRWARFPYAVVQESDGATTVRIADARYVREIDAPRLRNFGTTSLEFEDPLN